MSFSELFVTEHDCREVEIEVINRCNARCVHCPPFRRLQKPSSMTVELFEKIIQKYNEYYTDKQKPRFMFAGGGEPLLNTHLEDFIKMCSDGGYPTTIITNAQLLTVERLKKLLASGVTDINVSIHAIDPEEYRKVLNLDFQTTLDNLIAANTYIKENQIEGVRLCVVCNELKLVSATTEEMEAFWSEKGIEFTGQKPIWNRAGNLKDFESIVKDINNHKKANFEIPVWCLMPKYRDIIDTVGDFLKCSCDYFGESEIYGNVEDISLEELYKKLQHVLDDEEKPEECINCIKSQSNVFFSELSQLKDN